MAIDGTAPAPQVWPTLRAHDALALIEFLVTLFARATAAGARVAMALTDLDYGSRDFQVLDPEGNRWAFGTYRGHGWS